MSLGHEYFIPGLLLLLSHQGQHYNHWLTLKIRSFLTIIFSGISIALILRLSSVAQLELLIIFIIAILFYQERRLIQAYFLHANKLWRKDWLFRTAQVGDINLSEGNDFYLIRIMLSSTFKMSLHFCNIIMWESCFDSCLESSIIQLIQLIYTSHFS